jgi:excisionase family DNA binding protein
MSGENLTNFKHVDQLLTVQETAVLLHVHSNTLRRWSDSGMLKPYRLGLRGDRRFRRDEVIYFMETYYPYLLGKRDSTSPVLA